MRCGVVGHRAAEQLPEKVKAAFDMPGFLSFTDPR